MARRDLSNRDASSHAASELDYVIKKRQRADEAARTPTVSVNDALSGERVYATKSERDITRVLFISKDTELLNPTKQTLDGYIDLSDLFDEVHILILRTGIPTRQPVLRVADNVWMYTAAAQFSWWLKNAAVEMIDDQLVFANGFRVDLVVARDPFESAWVAQWLHGRYGTPVQLHLLEPVQKKNGLWQRLMARHFIPKFLSIRTATETMQHALQKKYTVRDIDTLPRFQNYTSLITTQKTLSLKDKYSPHIFFILFVGKLDHSSTLYQVIDAGRFVLRNKRVALVVIGDGPAKSEFIKRAKTLDINEQIIFESRIEDIAPYLKAANMLIVSDTDKESEEIVLQAAAVGTPMILAETTRRADIFPAGEAALQFTPGDVPALTIHINELLANIELRKHFTEATQAIIAAKFHPDPTIYREAYRNSVERALFVQEQEDDADPTPTVTEETDSN